MTSDMIRNEIEELDMFETATFLQRRSELLQMLRRMIRMQHDEGHGVPEVTVAAGLCADAEDVLLSMQGLGYTVIVAFVRLKTQELV